MQECISGEVEFYVCVYLILCLFFPRVFESTVKINKRLERQLQNHHSPFVT